MSAVRTPRVFITGLGVVSPLGAGVQVFWDALLAGRSGIGPVTRFDARAYPVQIAAEIKPDVLTAAQPDLTRLEQITVLAGQEALAQAGLAPDDGQAEYWVGTTVGELLLYEQRYRALIETRDRAAFERFKHELIVGNSFFSFATKAGERLGTRGYPQVNTNTCAAGAYAISLAAERIRQGVCGRALAGGVDLFSQIEYAGFSNLRALAPERCQPFCLDRKGLVIGEASAFLVLESEAEVQKRQVQPLAELAGYAWSNDAYHLSAPQPEGRGVQAVLRQSLTDARLDARDLGALVAHGTGTPSNDRVEAQAIHHVMGADAPRVTAPKSMLGHSRGAASAVEALIGVQIVATGQVPPTIGYDRPDPECPVGVVTQAEPLRPGSACLCNASGFGGINSALIFRSAGRRA